MTMELTCTLVLVIVGFVSASPHGYGTKGGAAAKADAHAVAGAYSNARSLPLSIPSGAGYSGSFSQSSSSSSSSASSSSSSFSYSGSGTIGGVVPGGSGCGSGNCNGGAAKGSAAATSAGGYGSNIPTSSYGHKYGSGEPQGNKAQNCGSDGCQGTNDSGALENGAAIGSQSTSDAKAAASAGAGYSAGSDCKGSDCNNLPGADVKCTSGQCGLNAKCSLGDCGAVSGSPTDINESGKKCISGQCASNQVSSSIDYATNDIHVPISGSSHSRPNYGAVLSGCSNGDCSLSGPESQTASNYNKPATDLTAPKQEPASSGLNYENSQSGAPSCSGGSCTPTSQTKAPYTSSNHQNVNGINQTPTSNHGGFSKFPLGSISDTKLSSVPSAFGVVPGTRPPTYTGNIGVTAGAGAQQEVKEDLPAYTGGFGGPAGVLKPNEFNAPTLSYGNTPIAIKPASPGYEGLSKPGYSHGSSNYSPVKPPASSCVPGAPGCDVTTSHNPSDCASGNCGANPSASGHGSPSTGKPNNSFESSPSYSPVIPLGSACTPGTSGCAPPTSASGPSGCVSGNCGVYPSSTGYGGASSITPGYSHGNAPPYSPVKPSGPACVPGTAGCNTVPGYDGSSNPKPSYSQGILPSYSPVIPSSPGCTPGTPGCISSPATSVTSDCVTGNCGSYPTSTGYAGFSGSKPSYTQASSPSYSPVNPSSPACAPGTPGCISSPATSVPSDCTTGNCGSYPTSSSYGGSSGIKPSYSHGSSPLYSPGKPTGSACALGIPGCDTVSSPHGSSACTSGNCAYPSAPSYDSSLSIKPSYSHGSSPSFSPAISSIAGIKPIYSQGSSSSYSPVNPSSPACTPGTPGCVSSPSASFPSSCTTGNCGTNLAGYGGSAGINPSYSLVNSPSYSPLKPSGPACAPGIPGCKLAPSGNECASGNCAKPSVPGYDGSSSIKPSYSQGSSYFPLKPSEFGCAPGTLGCDTLPSPNVQIDCASGNCGSHASSPQGCSPGSPGCSQLPLTINSGSTGIPHIVSSKFPSTQTTTGIDGPSYRASGAGSSLNHSGYGSHGTGSIQTSYNKPASPGFSSGSSDTGAYTPGFPSVSSAPGVVPGVGSPSYTGSIGATAGVITEQGTKGKRPTYTGGFGGPSGILKPNEFSTPTLTYENKPLLTTNTLTAKPACTSGICDAQAPHGSPLGALVTAGASASANAVVYTGGFGGPPGFLKPYDSGKIDLKGPTSKQLQGSLLDSQQEIGGSGIHSSHSNGVSQISGSTAAQASAAAISTAGVGGGDKLHGGNDHEHHGAGGCGGICGGSGSSSSGYSGALGLSKSGILDDTNNGLATAGAAAKSVATASSGARAYGGSYASSSASAHAGASVKGGYGRR